MKETTYWKRQYTKFIKDVLHQRKSYYLGLAQCMDEEIKHFVENKERYLKENPDAI